MMAAETTAPLIWRNMPVPVIAGLSDTRKKAGLPYAVRPLGEVFQANACQLPKESAPAFLPSLYAESDARAHEAQRARGRFVALVGDIDKGDHALERVKPLIDAFAAGSAWVIYSTASAQPAERRWRVVLPLDAPVSFALWYDAQLALTAHMVAGGIEMDTCAARPGQVSFLPNVPAAMRDGAGEPIFFERVGTALDAPGLQLHSGPVADGIAVIERKRAQDDVERERIRQQAEARRKSRPAPSNDDSVIDTFNRSVYGGSALVPCDTCAAFGDPDDRVLAVGVAPAEPAVADQSLPAQLRCAGLHRVAMDLDGRNQLVRGQPTRACSPDRAKCNALQVTHG